MSLSSALETAKSSIATSQTQTALISRNIANLNTVGATRKYAQVSTTADGRVEVRSVAQSSNSVLYRNMLDAASAVGRSSVIANGFQRVEETIGDTSLGRSPSAMVSKLGDALRSLAATPNSYELARSATDAAGDLVTTLNEATKTVQTIRQDADTEIGEAAADMNAILARIEGLNTRIVTGTRGRTDITDLADQRDQAVAELASYVGVTSRTRGDNDLVLYTDSGVTLFEAKARLVEFTATPGITAVTTQGGALKIDGTAVTGGNAYMPIKSGKVFGLVSLRDTEMVTYQNQLDEVARGLINAFSESDQSGGGLPDAPGLFVDGAGGAVTGAASVVHGLAGTIRLAQNARDNPQRLRDGGIAGPAYVYNTTGAAGFTARLSALVDALTDTSRTYSPEADADGTANIADFAASSLSWLEARRSAAGTESDYKTTLLERTQETLSNETGINMEEQMSLLIQIERSYQASSKLISTIDEMLKTLLQSI